MQHQMVYSNEIEALMPKHNPAIEGHVEFNWDQELLLQLAFALMDSEKKGRLAVEEFNQIANNTAIHSLLRFTVFWSFIKRKQWSFFLSMFRNADIKPTIPLLGEHNESESDDIRISYLTYSDWMATASRISRERGVKLRHIRSQEEHAAINSPYLSINPATIASSKTSAARDLYTTSMNTAKEYLNRQSFERECYMSRKLNVGE